MDIRELWSLRGLAYGRKMMELIGLKDRKNFLEYTLNPAIADGFIRMLYPESPRRPHQKYLLTGKGQELYYKMHKTNKE